VETSVYFIRENLLRNPLRLCDKFYLDTLFFCHPY